MPMNDDWTRGFSVPAAAIATSESGRVPGTAHAVQDAADQRQHLGVVGKERAHQTEYPLDEVSEALGEGEGGGLCHGPNMTLFRARLNTGHHVKSIAEPALTDRFLCDRISRRRDRFGHVATYRP
jgi:hypothetical protein